MHDRIFRSILPLLFGCSLAACAMGDAQAQDASQDTRPAQSREKFGDPAQYEARDLPVTRQDLETLERATALLGSETAWNRSDDRRCADDEAMDKRSLYCALERASADVYGSHDPYKIADHRRVALQEVRFAVEEATRGRELSHRLMEFNNLPETTLADVQRVLAQATARVRARLPAE